jgi:hypothetical protein
MSAKIPTIHEVHDSKFSLSGKLEVLTSIYTKLTVNPLRELKVCQNCLFCAQP